MTADDDNTINRSSTSAHPLAGSGHTVETALAPERYVRASVYALSLKIIHDLRKELGVGLELTGQ